LNMKNFKINAFDYDFKVKMIIKKVFQ